MFSCRVFSSARTRPSARGVVLQMALPLWVLGFGLAVAAPVPGISDLPATIPTPVRVPFSCPDKVFAADSPPLATRRCDLVIEANWLNVMGRQRIARSDVERIWETYTYRPNGLIVRTWNLLYRLDGGPQKRVLVLRDLGDLAEAGGLQSESVSSLLNIWIGR